MSYDIRFGVRVDGTDKFAVIGAPERDSPTYNNRDIFVKSMDWDYKQGEWYQMSEVLPKIERGIHELTFNADTYRSLEPSNGWGGVSSSLEALQSIIDWFGNPWERGWDEEIPLECIYMRW